MSNRQYISALEDTIVSNNAMITSFGMEASDEKAAHQETRVKLDEAAIEVAQLKRKINDLMVQLDVQRLSFARDQRDLASFRQRQSQKRILSRLNKKKNKGAAASIPVVSESETELEPIYTETLTVSEGEDPVISLFSPATGLVADGENIELQVVQSVDLPSLPPRNTPQGGCAGQDLPDQVGYLK